MGKLYFVRHGETVWNVENKICGCTDSPLTEKGVEQARALGRKILEEGIEADEILFSPLTRARDTAMELSRVTGIPARAEPRLREQNFGRWEGTPRDGRAFLADKQNFVTDYEGGESMARVCQRIYNLLDQLTARPERCCLLVAHNGIARVVHSYFYSMSNEAYAAFGIPNCSISVYEFPG